MGRSDNRSRSSSSAGKRAERGRLQGAAPRHLRHRGPPEGAGRAPIPVIPVPSGAVFGGRNGSCCGKRPPVWCCCSSDEPELWEPLLPGRAPPLHSGAPMPLRGAAPPRPWPRPAPGARSKLSDMLRPGRLKRSWEVAGVGTGRRPGAGRSRLAAARALHFQFHPRAQRRDGRGRARLTAPPRGLDAPVAIATGERGPGAALATPGPAGWVTAERGGGSSGAASEPRWQPHVFRTDESARTHGVCVSAAGCGGAGGTASPRNRESLQTEF